MMESIALVVIQGNEAPQSYEDFSLMLESSLVPLRGRTIELAIDAGSFQLRSYADQFAKERRMAHSYAPFEIELQPTYHIAFVNGDVARRFDNIEGTASSFKLSTYSCLERRPTVILLPNTGNPQ